jgi:hypothetical protein
MRAFQTVLFPSIDPDEIKRLNHLDIRALLTENLDVRAEVERAIIISLPSLTMPEFEIHLVGDLIEVMLNLRTWNREMEAVDNRSRWGKRTITFFVYDPTSCLFAPSKFCAYVLPKMTIELYVCFDKGSHRMDGNRAQRHLCDSLGMSSFRRTDVPQIAAQFEDWIGRFSNQILVHPKGPIFLLPPKWFS